MNKPNLTVGTVGPQIPLTGFTQVTKEQFYGRICADGLDVNPASDGRFRSDEGDCSYWKLRNQTLWGKSFNKGGERFYISDQFATR